MKTGAIIAITFVISGIIVFFFVNGTLELNQEKLDDSLKKIPQSIKDVGKTAKDFATDTTTVLRETISEHLEKVQLGPLDATIEDISEIPKKTQEKNLINQKPIIDKTELERLVHQLTNQYRTENGLSPLLWDIELSNVAKSHSQDMASRNYFSHETPEGTNPTGRGTSQGYKCEKIIGNILYLGIAENIFQNNLAFRVWYTDDIPTSYEWNSQDEIAKTTVDGWMDSPGHRKNILTKTFDREGIGVEITTDDKVYITQNFC
ncbi:MAG: CAP domain-containing protein [Thaumarchaeota archaeon]|nr:CAP domain-containing protein [Nitrososphaerota archaeon]